MKHGGNVWQGDGPAQWLDYSAKLRPEGTAEWVKTALLNGMENARYYPDPSMKRAKQRWRSIWELPRIVSVLPQAEFRPFRW